jgi:radical SAM superfamily enzyme YgiQ (UPF0313 family)
MNNITCDVLLINPPVSNREMPQDEIAKKYFSTLENAGRYLLGDLDIEPNYGLLSIAANVRKHFSDRIIKILDLNILDKHLRRNENRPIKNEDIKDELKKYKALISGISFMTSSYGEWGQDVIKYTKEISDFLFLGGIHPTVEYRDIFKRNKEDIDGIVIGEGEVIFVKILSQIFNTGKVKGIQHLYTGNEINVSKEILSNKQLSDLPIPAYDLMYKENEVIIPRVYTSRGCNFNCSICSVGDFYTTKEIKDPIYIERNKVIDDIKEINSKYKASHYVIGDLCSYSNTQTFSMFLDSLRDLRENENIQNFNLWCQTRGDIITEDLAIKLSETGFKQVAIGCEGGKQEQLDSINKKEKVEKIKKALKYMRDCNIETQCYWVLGLPGESKESIKATQDMILHYLYDGLTTIPHITILVPYPNTSVVKHNGIRILHNDYSKYWMNCDLYGYGKPVYNTVDPTTQKTLLDSDYIFKSWLETLQKVTEYFEGRYKL